MVLNFHLPVSYTHLDVYKRQVFGVIAAEIGLVDRQSLNKANSFGWMITVLMAFIYEGLNKATPEMLMEVVLDVYKRQGYTWKENSKRTRISNYKYKNG